MTKRLERALPETQTELGKCTRVQLEAMAIKLTGRLPKRIATQSGKSLRRSNREELITYVMNAIIATAKDEAIMNAPADRNDYYVFNAKNGFLSFLSKAHTVLTITKPVVSSKGTHCIQFFSKSTEGGVHFTSIDGAKCTCLGKKHRSPVRCDCWHSLAAPVIARLLNELMIYSPKVYDPKKTEGKIFQAPDDSQCQRSREVEVDYEYAEAKANYCAQSDYGDVWNLG
jgi:hypothetical protein